MEGADESVRGTGGTVEKDCVWVDLSTRGVPVRGIGLARARAVASERERVAASLAIAVASATCSCPNRNSWFKGELRSFLLAAASKRDGREAR